VPKRPLDSCQKGRTRDKTGGERGGCLSGSRIPARAVCRVIGPDLYPRLLFAPSVSSAAADISAKTLRHDQRHYDMNGEENHDRGHGEEMHEPRGVISTEQW
jgi:hypothetical protein